MLCKPATDISYGCGAPHPWRLVVVMRQLLASSTVIASPKRLCFNRDRIGTDMEIQVESASISNVIVGNGVTIFASVVVL